MTYEEALAFLQNRRALGIKPGLDRVKALLDRFSNPQNDLPCVHVAGTNGKGSTAVFLSSILKEAGYRAGLFTSPYLSSPREMYKIQSESISIEDFCALVSEAEGYCLELDRLMGQGPTEYEIYAAIGLAYFKRKNCDIAVIEACMGGRFDCTNVLSRVEACVITKLSLEHQAFLGSTLSEIAWHKAGILKEGRPAVCYPQEEAAMRQIEKEAELKKAAIIIPNLNEIEIDRHSKEGIRFRYAACERLFLAMPALYQTENAAMAVEASRVLCSCGWRIPDRAVRDGLHKAKWPGRFEYLSRSPDFILDCCHNPDGVKAFIQSYKSLYGNEKAIILLSILKDKDYITILKELSGIAQILFAMESDNPRALPAGELKKAADNYCGFAAKSDTINEAVSESLRFAEKDGIICALGSHFHAESVKRAVHNNLGGMLC